MTTTTRQDKINATIAKLTVRLEKFIKGEYDKKYEKTFGSEPTTSMVVPPTDRYSSHAVVALPDGQTQPQWKYWRDCDKFDLLQQIMNNHKKLEKAKELDAKEDAKKAKTDERQVKLENIPECLKEFAAEVETATIADRIRIHNYLRSLPYPNYKDHSSEANAIRADRMDWNEDKMRREVKRNVEDLILNLMYRVYKKCGNIVDVRGLYLNSANEGTCINGRIIGDKGTAYVESILAGGYNIQCLHVRVLVK